MNWRRLALALAALAIVAIGLLTIVDGGWRDPYADQWRMYPFYLLLPFPDSVLQLENGHRPVLPGLVRVAELYWRDGGQTLQLAVGALAALATLLILAAIALRDRSLPGERRWLAVATCAAGVFWLGNGRFLLHGNESVHGYLLTAFVAAAIALLLRPSAHPGRNLFVACLCAAGAAFCFGPGIAAFVAVIVVLVLDRRWRALPWVVLAIVLTLVLYFSLPGAGGVSAVLHLQPLENLRVSATWLASMWVHLLQPFHDPEAARGLPGWLASLTTPIAQAWQGQFGSLWLRHGPATVLGLTAIGHVVVATVSSLRTPIASTVRRGGLALAWFSIATAGLVSLSRLDYFAQYPDQIMAQRYLPWSSLFWTGVLLTWLGSPSRQRWPHVASATVVLALLAGTLASSPAYRGWALQVRDGLAVQAAGVAVGTLAQSQPLWESKFEEMLAARPLLAERQRAVFAWPELRQQPGPAPQGIDDTAMTLTLSVQPVDNRFGGEGVAVSAQALSRSGDNTVPERLLLADADGRATALMVRQRRHADLRYAGYAWPGVDADTVLASRVLARENDGWRCLANCAR